MKNMSILKKCRRHKKKNIMIKNHKYTVNVVQKKTYRELSCVLNTVSTRVMRVCRGHVAIHHIYFLK